MHTFRVPAQPAEIRALLGRLLQALHQGRIMVTRYAAQRAAEELGWERRDILQQLGELEEDDFERVEDSMHWSASRIWVFCPLFIDETLWIRLVECEGIVVVSFHGAEDDE